MLSGSDFPVVGFSDDLFSGPDFHVGWMTYHDPRFLQVLRIPDVLRFSDVFRFRFLKFSGEKAAEAAEALWVLSTSQG